MTVNEWTWLVSNGRTFTKTGGRLDLTTGLQPADPCLESQLFKAKKEIKVNNALPPISAYSHVVFPMKTTKFKLFARGHILAYAGLSVCMKRIFLSKRERE